MDGHSPRGGQDGPLVIVVGLEAEARVARSWGVPVVVGGGGAEGATRAVAGLGPVAGLLSFGLAGGLSRAVRAGELLIPHTVVEGPERWMADPALMAALGGGTGHVLLGGGAVLATVAAKRAAAATADAVDLESAAVAREAARRGVPFAVLRAVCDTASRALPLAALVALDTAGRIGVLRVLAAVARRPWDVPALIGLAQDASRARAALAGRVHGTSLVGFGA